MIVLMQLPNLSVIKGEISLSCKLVTDEEGVMDKLNEVMRV